jgi:hypothetical protein
MFVGGFLLFAAVITWGTAALLSPHGEAGADGTEHVRAVVVTFMRNSAIGTLVLAALSGWLLFPPRRPRMPLRDWGLGLLILLLVASSLYQLVRLRAFVG